MKKQQQINYVIDKLSHWCSYIKLCNKRNFTDMDLISEGFIQQLLNILYDTNFINLNKEHINYPGLDLGDFEKKIGVQITSKKNYSGKIIEDHKKIYVKKDTESRESLADIFSEKIIFFMISTEEKIKFQKKTLKILEKLSEGKFDEKNIININDLIQKIVCLFDEDYAKFLEVYKLISRNIDVLPEVVNDVLVVEEILSCFNRPAFTVQFRDECSLGDFEIALKNTISLINTGKALDGVTIKYNVTDISSKEIRKKFSELVEGINKLRSIFVQMRLRGYATKCQCGKPDCKLIFNNDYEFCCLMNDLRTLILNYAWKISDIVKGDFRIHPSYISERLGHPIYENLNQGSLISNMEFIYDFYDRKLER